MASVSMFVDGGGNMANPLKTIRLHCLDCSNGSYLEVQNCPCTNCKLYPYRFGKNPDRKPKKMSEENKLKAAERLRKAREAKDVL